MMSMSDKAGEVRRDRIPALIEAELDMQVRHLDLLQRQRAALVACDRAEFGRLHEEHEDLLSEMETQQLRRTKLFENGLSLRSEIARWPVEDQRSAQDKIARLAALVAKVRAQIKQNDVLVANDLRLVNFQLNLFVSAAKTGLQYVSSGASATIQVNRLINRVA